MNAEIKRVIVEELAKILICHRLNEKAEVIEKAWSGFSLDYRDTYRSYAESILIAIHLFDLIEAAEKAYEVLANSCNIMAECTPPEVANAVGKLYADLDGGSRGWVIGRKE